MLHAINGSTGVAMNCNPGCGGEENAMTTAQTDGNPCRCYRLHGTISIHYANRPRSYPICIETHGIICGHNSYGAGARHCAISNFQRMQVQ
jgi:hypothetical protein